MIVWIAFFVFIFLLLIYCVLRGVLPRSEVSFCKEKPKRKFESFDDTFRYFDVLEKLLEEEINEIFTCDCIEWENDCYSPGISFFDNIDCKYYRKLPSRIIEPFTFIYFPDNGLKWNNEQFLYNSKSNSYFFPEKNSVLYCVDELEWKGDTNVCIVLGKKII